jgi:hypothetical protein
MQKKIASAWSVKKKKIASARSGNSRHARARKPMPQKHGRSTTLLSRSFVTARGNSENSDSRELKNRNRSILWSLEFFD